MAQHFRIALLYSEQDGRYGVVSAERIDGLGSMDAPGGFWLYGRNGQRRQFATADAAQKVADQLNAEQVSA